MTMGEKIRYFRQMRGIPPETLAVRTGICKEVINEYEIGCHNPQLEHLEMIAKELHISVLEFLDIEIQTEADMLAMLKKVSPFFRWESQAGILGERKEM